MVPYVLMFGLSCLNFRLAYLLRKYKTIKIMFVLIGLLLPCVLAGARDNTIGTDVLVYGDAYLNYAQRYNSLSSFMNFDYLGGEPDVYKRQDLGCVRCWLMLSYCYWLFPQSAD